MRIFAVPLAILLAACLYMLLPKAADLAKAGVLWLYGFVLARFTRKGRTDEKPALLVFLLLLGGCAALIGAIHPLASAVVMAPLFTAFSILPGCAKIKDELDSGAYANDIPAYEARVRETCMSLAPAFSGELLLPMLLCCIGTPLYMGCALGYMGAALHVLSGSHDAARRVNALLVRLSDAVFAALLALCSGVVGRNPMRIQGRGAKARLLSALGIAGTETDTHAPVAGDIPQGIFLCCFCTIALCIMLCAALFVLC